MSKSKHHARAALWPNGPWNWGHDNSWALHCTAIFCWHPLMHYNMLAMSVDQISITTAVCTCPWYVGSSIAMKIIIPYYWALTNKHRIHVTHHQTPQIPCFNPTFSHLNRVCLWLSTGFPEVPWPLNIGDPMSSYVLKLPSSSTMSLGAQSWWGWWMRCGSVGVGWYLDCKKSS